MPLLLIVLVTGGVLLAGLAGAFIWAARVSKRNERRRHDVMAVVAGLVGGNVTPPDSELTRWLARDELAYCLSGKLEVGPVLRGEMRGLTFEAFMVERAFTAWLDSSDWEHSNSEWRFAL
jgi:hypothetical protein